MRDFCGFPFRIGLLRLRPCALKFWIRRSITRASKSNRPALKFAQNTGKPVMKQNDEFKPLSQAVRAESCIFKPSKLLLQISKPPNFKPLIWSEWKLC